MSFLVVGDAPIAKRRLYLFDITLITGMKVVKIGVASHGSSLDRMLQVNRAYYQKYRSTFMCNIKRDREVPADVVFKYETLLHRFFNNYQYTPKVAFDGSTELFAIPLDDAVMAFEAVINGEVPDFTYQMPSTKEAEDSLPF